MSFEGGWVHRADVRCPSCLGAGRFSLSAEPDASGPYGCAVCDGRGTVAKGCGGEGEVGVFAFCLAEQLPYPRVEFTRAGPAG